MKKYLFIILFFLILLIPCANAESFQLYFGSEVSSTLSSDDSVPADLIQIYKTGDKHYLFLPSGWDHNALRIYFTGTQSVTIENLTYNSGDQISLQPGKKVSLKFKNGAAYTVNVMQSQNIPAIFLTTESGNINALKEDKHIKEQGHCLILHQEGTILYDDPLEYIRTRGNASFYYPKKAFQIKLTAATSLFGMNADKKWVLLANYLDKSLLRNTIAFSLARYAQAYTYVPGTQPVDLYLNHQYYGSFLLTEKCEIDPDRLDIYDIEKATEKLNDKPLEEFPSFGDRLYARNAQKGYKIENNPEDISGGYLILANSRVYYASEASGFVTKKGQAFSIDQPKYASKEQLSYLSALFQQIENGLFSEEGKDPDTGVLWTDLLDINSFAHRFLQAEVTADYDGQKPYFYKDVDVKDTLVYCAPVWDQDNIFGANSSYSNARRFYTCNDDSLPYFWFPQAMKHSDFQLKVIELYENVYAPALRILLGQEKDPDGILLSLDEYAQQISASAAMDNIRWPIGKNRGTNFNMRTGSTPAENVEYLRNFIQRRLEFLNEQWMQK